MKKRTKTVYFLVSAFCGTVLVSIIFASHILNSNLENNDPFWFAFPFLLWGTIAPLLFVSVEQKYDGLIDQKNAHEP